MLRSIRDYFRALQGETPEIKYFIFSNDEQTLRDTVGGFDDFYLFVDYGEFGSTLDRANRITDRLDVAVTIAQPLGARNLSPEEMAEYQFLSFDLCARIRQRMWAGQREHPWLQYLSPEHGIEPFVAPEISRSVGHTLMFSVQGPDLLDVKKRLP